MDFANHERDRQILALVLSRQQMAWPFTAPPDLPRDRAAALRTAFDKTMKDSEYLAEARQRRFDVNPMSGAAIEKLIVELYSAPPDVIAASKSATSQHGK